MTPSDAAELLGLASGSDPATVQRRYAELYSDYQVRLTNAPTAALQKLYREKLAALAAAQQVLLGAGGDADRYRELPALGPVRGDPGQPAQPPGAGGMAAAPSAPVSPAAGPTTAPTPARPSGRWGGAAAAGGLLVVAGVVALLFWRQAQRTTAAEGAAQQLRVSLAQEAAAQQLRDSLAALALGEGFGPVQFASLPAGRFLMGSSNGDADERPIHEVAIAALRMQRTEVTQAQWQAVMGSNPSQHDSCPRCPVEQVSWEDVQDFLQRLDARGHGRFRLPTEAEWEYAARAGTSGDYGGTGNLDEMGWHEANSGGEAHPVGQKRANAWGLYDMHGNVNEWVSDWYNAGYYARSPGRDPPGPAGGQYRVIRGGGFRSNPVSARAARRFAVKPWQPAGFRLVRTE